MKKFYFLLIAMLVGLSANAAYYLVGGFNEWSNPGTHQFQAVGDGTYTYTLDGTLTSGFKITQGTWTDSQNFASNGSMIKVGEVYKLGGGGSGNIEIEGGNVENPTLILNPTAKTLLIKGQTVEAKYAYQIHGSFTGSWVSTDLTEKDGAWVIENFEVTSESAAFGIKKNDATTGSQVAWISAAGNNKITEAGEFSCKVDGTNFAIAKGTYGFSFDPETMVLTVTGEGGGEIVENVIYQIHGSFTGSWASTDLTKNDDGSWSIEDFEVTEATANFGIRQMTNGSQTNWYAADGDNKITGAGEYQCKVNGTNFTIAAGTYGFSFDPETMMLTVTGEGGDLPDEDYTGWYLNVQGDYNNYKPSGVAFNADGTAVAKNQAIGTGEFELKIWNGKEDIFYSTGSAIEPDVEYTVSDAFGVKMTIEGATEDQEFDVYFDAKTKTMKVVPCETPAVITYALHGSFTGEWASTDLTEKDGAWVIENLEVTADTAEFGIKQLTNGEQTKWYSAEGENEITGTGAYPCSTEGNNFSIASGTYNFSFDPTTLVLDVVKISSNVNVIAIDENVAVEYYNLQGVRVAEPTNGLYIVKRGNTVSKQVIR